jgi:tetratricopeptide (TPR) repeat protein
LHGVKDQLASLNKPCLILLDNCDDTKTNFNRYIPNSAQVSVVLTTRLSDADKYASLDRQEMSPKQFVRLYGLDPASATQLILRSSGAQKQSDDTIQHAAQIADALDYHPLAIVVASSLLQSNVYPIKKYAEALKDRLTQKELLETETEQSTYCKVSSTFEISATVLRESSASDESSQHALDLLDLLAFMDSQGVSEDIFVSAWEYEEEALTNCRKQYREPQDLSMWHVAQARKYFPDATIDARRRALRKARAHLVQLSLLRQGSEANTVYMHSLVRLWTRERIQYPTKPWAAAASILALSAQGCQSWLSYSPQLALHCETNFRWRKMTEGIELHSEALCRVWSNFAWRMLENRHPQVLDVVMHFSREVQSQSRVAIHDPLVTEPQYLLAILSEQHREYSQAVTLLEDVVSTRTTLAEDHPSRLDSQLVLARTYLGLGRTSEAVEISEHVVRLGREGLTDEHHSRYLHQLAKAYLEDGRVSQAIRIFEHVIQMQVKLAVDHPDRPVFQHNLAQAYLEDGRTLKAIEILEHVVKLEEKLAADHPHRLGSQHELAGAYLEDGRTSQAIEIFEYVVRMREKLAASHLDRLASQHELARAYLEDGRTSQAIKIFEHVVKWRERKLPADHPSQLASQCHLGQAYLKDGRIFQAVEILERVVRIQEKLAAEHLDRLVSQHELARAYWGANRFVEADKLMTYVVDVKQRTLPEGHRVRVLSEKVLAMIREDLGNPAAVPEVFTASADQEPGDIHEDDKPGNL